MKDPPIGDELELCEETLEGRFLEKQNFRNFPVNQQTAPTGQVQSMKYVFIKPLGVLLFALPGHESALDTLNKSQQ